MPPHTQPTIRITRSDKSVHDVPIHQYKLAALMGSITWIHPQLPDTVVIETRVPGQPAVWSATFALHEISGKRFAKPLVAQNVGSDFDKVKTLDEAFSVIAYLREKMIDELRAQFWKGQLPKEWFT